MIRNNYAQVICWVLLLDADGEFMVACISCRLIIISVRTGVALGGARVNFNPKVGRGLLVTTGCVCCIDSGLMRVLSPCLWPRGPDCRRRREGGGVILASL